jgi:hypothetical protein
VGGEEVMATILISRCTDEVSQVSNALSIETASPAGKGCMSSDDLAEPFTSLILEEPVPTRVAEDRMLLGAPLDVGVRGGECRVMSCEGKLR